MPDLIDTRMASDERYLLLEGNDVAQVFGTEAGVAVTARLAALWNLALGVETEVLATLPPLARLVEERERMLALLTYAVQFGGTPEVWRKQALEVLKSEADDA